MVLMLETWQCKSLTLTQLDGVIDMVVIDLLLLGMVETVFRLPMLAVLSLCPEMMSPASSNRPSFPKQNHQTILRYRKQ